MTKSKKWFKSRTQWLAIITVAAGIVAVLESNFPAVGWIAIVKGIVDFLLRYVTSAPLE